jgi:hypothetical protein
MGNVSLFFFHHWPRRDLAFFVRGVTNEPQFAPAIFLFLSLDSFVSSFYFSSSSVTLG